jgi:hypothetical protein
MATEEMVSEMRARIDELESRLESLEQPAGRGPKPFGRRHLLAAAGSAIAGGVLGSGSAAGAASGDPLILGATNTASSETEVLSTDEVRLVRTHYDETAGGGQPVLSIAQSVVPPGDRDNPTLQVSTQSFFWAGGRRAFWAVSFNDQGPGAYLQSTSGDGLHVVIKGNPFDPLPGHNSVVTADSRENAPETVGFHATTGGRAHLLLEPRATAGAPTTLPHDAGEVALDANTNLHVCHSAGTPGSWHRLLNNRAPLGTAAGAIVLRDSPFRLYDSRPGKPSALPGPKGTLTPGASRDLDVVGQGSPPVPAEAIGVLATVTVTATGTSGHLRAHATGTPPPNTSIINWDHAGQTIATTTMIRLGASGAVTLRASSTATHFLVDILGWIA